ncbi:dTMP kinase [Sphingobacterium lactis]|uniref:Thymidylate kinase n=1 Tax=Sphingobacterium lactis TaxID=797291 RepID=A0A1H5XN54_9SPHI|nr:dTMP kinase [Sphingobacterium lactis]SEG13219.1 dTMP kinase [Sphingobacterium lactis]
MAKKNLFIVLEGIDGSGKSTQTKLLKEKLAKAGHKLYTTFEPTDSPIGSLIRNIFNRRVVTDNRAIAALFVADRLDHLLNPVNGIIKKLEEGYTVICDRYYFSSYAYQSEEVSLNWLIEANSISQNLLKPDVNIYIDIDPEISMERLNKDRSSLEIFENLSNLQKVRSRYQEAFRLLEDKENIAFVDGNQSVEEISNAIFDIVSALQNNQE